MSEWKKIEDSKVRHLWECQDEECENSEVVMVNPTFYEENGTLVCYCGEDMRYIRTEIKI